MRILISDDLSSEAKAILTAFPEEREPDRHEIYAFLAGGQPDVGDATFFRDIRSVPPGTYLEFGRDRCAARVAALATARSEAVTRASATGRLPVSSMRSSTGAGSPG